MNCITQATSVPATAHRVVFVKAVKKDLFYTIFNYAIIK